MLAARPGETRKGVGGHLVDSCSTCLARKQRFELAEDSVKISCPNCPAAYELEDARIPPAGLSIKCPRCKTPFTVHKPKPGDTARVVKGSAVPLPGQAGAKSMPPGPAASRPPPRGVPLPGGGAPGEAPPPQGMVTPGAVPLPGLGGDKAPPETTSIDFRPSQPPPSAPPALDFGAIPLPGFDDGPSPPARSGAFAPRPPAASRPPPAVAPDRDPGPAPSQPSPAGSDPFGLDFDIPLDEVVDPLHSAASTVLDVDFPDATPPAPPKPAQTAAMDDIFAVDVPEALPPAHAARPPRSAIDEPGISFDFVEAPAPRPQPSAPPPSAGADLLDFVDDKPAEETAIRPVDQTARSAGTKARRPPPPMIARSSSAGGKFIEDLDIDLESHPGVAPAEGGAADPKQAKKERKKQEKKKALDERKLRDREERARRKSDSSGSVSTALERLRNPRVLVATFVGLLLLVLLVVGWRSGWLKNLIPEGRRVTPAQTQVIQKGMERLSDGSFAAAREALGSAAELLLVLPDDERVKAFFVLSASELKLAYGQVGRDWDQAKGVIEKMTSNNPEQNLARGAYALASGDVARGKLLLAPLGDQPNADLESVYLFAQSLILGGEEPRAAQVLDNALKGKGSESTKLLLLRGLVARQKGQLPEAAGYFEKALQKSPANGRALIELADVKLRQGDARTTADLLDKALQPDVRKLLDATEEARASMLLGRLAAVNHQNKEAEAAYDRAVALDPASAEIREAYGEFRSSRREWEKAAKQFDAALTSSSVSASVMAGAARAYLGTNRLLDADKRINEAVAKDGQNAHFIYLQGRVAEAIGKGEEAFKDYERALAKKPDLAEALVAEGQILLNRADKEKAQQKLEAALKAPARTSIEDEAAGDLALALGEKEQARGAFASALKKDPEDPQAHAGMGKTLAAMGELKPARVELEKALTEADNDASLAYEYGSLLRRTGESANALAALQKAVKIDGKDPRYRARLGAILVERGDFEGAEAQLRQGVLMNDRFAEGQLFLARALAGQKKLAEAVETIRKAVELDPGNAEYLYHLGLIYEQGQQVQDAIESFQKSIDKDPKNADAWEHLGQNLTVENRFGEAVSAFKKAAGLDPTRARIWAEVGDSEQQAGDLDGAIRHFQDALKEDPDLPGVWSKLGVAYKDKDCKGCKIKAMAAFKEAEKHNPADAVAHYELGYMYKDDGHRKEAINEFQRYLELRPDAGDLQTVQDDILYLKEESRRAP